jgi:hypothetical protein
MPSPAAARVCRVTAMRASQRVSGPASDERSSVSSNLTRRTSSPLGPLRAGRHGLGTVGEASAPIRRLFSLACAAVATRYLETLLFEVRPLDPPTFIGVAIVLGTTALLAAFLPARRVRRRAIRWLRFAANSCQSHANPFHGSETGATRPYVAAGAGPCAAEAARHPWSASAHTPIVVPWVHVRGRRRSRAPTTDRRARHARPTVRVRRRNHQYRVPPSTPCAGAVAYCRVPLELGRRNRSSARS